MPFNDTNSYTQCSKVVIFAYLLICFTVQTLALYHNNAKIKLTKNIIHSRYYQIHQDEKASNLFNKENSSIEFSHFLQCAQVLYSIPIDINQKSKAECTCPQRTKMYQTKDGKKCLSPQPVQYPQFVDIICGFLAFLIPAIVALVCRDKEEVERRRDSQNYTENRDNKDKGVQLRKGNPNQHKKNDSREQSIVRHVCLQDSSIKKTSVNNLVQSSFNIGKKSTVSSTLRLPRYASSIDISDRIQNVVTSRIPRYATSTDSPRSSLKYGYARELVQGWKR